MQTRSTIGANDANGDDVGLVGDDCDDRGGAVDKGNNDYYVQHYRQMETTTTN